MWPDGRVWWQIAEFADTSNHKNIMLMSSISGNLLLEADTEQHYLEIIIQFNFFIHQFPATHLTDNTNDDGDGGEYICNVVYPCLHVSSCYDN